MKKQLLLTCVAVAIAAHSAKAVEPGYRGFFDYGFMYGYGDFESSTFNELSTSHGYQIIPQLYVGAGLEAILFKMDGVFDYALPVFCEVRYDITQTKIAPFVNMRGGYSIEGEFIGYFVNPSAGVRFGLSDKVGLNVAAAYTYMPTGYTQKSHSGEDILQGFSLRVGIDF